MKTGKRESRRSRAIKTSRTAEKTHIKNLGGARLSRGGIRL